MNTTRRSTIRTLALVTVTIFGVEFVIMLILFRDLPSLTDLADALLDSTILSIVLYPILSWLVYRPLITEIDDRQRAEEVLRAKAMELEALNRVTDPTLAREDLESLLQSLLTRIVTIMDANAGAILLLDPAKQELVLKSAVGISEEQAVGFRVKVGEDFAGRVAANNAVFWVRDAEADPNISNPYIRASHVKAMLGAPMRIKEEPVGVVHVDFLSAREFSSPEKHLLEVVAERAVLAIYQAKLLDEVQRRVAELQAILNNMVDSVYACDTDGRVTLQNEAGLRLAGVRSAEEVTGTLKDVIERFRVRHADGRLMLLEELPLIRALAGETVVMDDEILLNLSTNRDVYARVNASPIRGAGKIVGAVSVVRDVSELLELDQLKDQFISTAAHELKTPLTIMKGYAQVLLRAGGDITPPRRLALEAIDRGADRINSIVNDLLNISLLQLGRLELKMERIDLPELVEQVVDRMALTSTRHRIEITRNDRVAVQGDRDHLEQVLEHLIENAIRFSPGGGKIELALIVQGDEAVISVRDFGVGIPESKQGRIFERFYRAHAGAPYELGGMGVGLFIAKEIVTRHGGRMWFESEEGRGSTFYFALPMTV